MLLLIFKLLKHKGAGANFRKERSAAISALRRTLDVVQDAEDSLTNTGNQLDELSGSVCVCELLH